MKRRFFVLSVKDVSNHRPMKRWFSSGTVLLEGDFRKRNLLSLAHVISVLASRKELHSMRKEVFMRSTGFSPVRSRFFVLIVAALCATMTLVISPTQASAQSGQPPLIDRELFFGDPEIAGAQISPDGKFI